MSVSRHPKKDLLNAELKPKKSFGQNFLIDQGPLSAISDAVKRLIGEDAIVVEFGGGLGALTGELLQAGLMVHTIERDRDLVPILKKKFQEPIEKGQLVVHENDAKTLDFQKCNLFDGKGKGVLCGNLPYNLTSSLLERALESHDKIAGAVFMMQKEVCDRILSRPGKKSYGVLSVLLAARFEMARVCDVGSQSFWPVPKVDSAVIALRSLSSSDQIQADWRIFKKIVKTAFCGRRKTIRNSLSSYPNIKEKLARLGIDSGLRAENLSVRDYAKLANAYEEE